MKSIAICTCALLCQLTVPAAVKAQDMDITFNPFPNAELREEAYLEYDRYQIPLSTPINTDDGFSSEETLALEGKRLRQTWFIENTYGSSPFAVYTNYREALQQEGFEILFICEEAACGEGGSTWSEPLDNSMATNLISDKQFYIAAKRPDMTAYVSLFVKGNVLGSVDYLLDVIEPAVLDTQRVTLTVDSLQKALDQAGKVALYDIQFDTGEATLTTASAEALDIVEQLLSSRSEWSLYVVGHTDDTGEREFNQALSDRRAASVVDALVVRGVPADRLIPFGAGPYSPVAGNSDESGRSLNRRVELVVRLPAE